MKTTSIAPAGNSIRVYVSLLKFGASSLACAVIDLSLFTLLTNHLFDPSPSGILAATVTARCLSGALNFTLNKQWCFASSGNKYGQACKYLCLFCAQMLLSWSIVALLSPLPVNLTILKMLTDSGLFVLSYFIQRHFIFKDKPFVEINLTQLWRASKKG